MLKQNVIKINRLFFVLSSNFIKIELISAIDFCCLSKEWLFTNNLKIIYNKTQYNYSRRRAISTYQFNRILKDYKNATPLLPPFATTTNNANQQQTASAHRTYQIRPMSLLLKRRKLYKNTCCINIKYMLIRWANTIIYTVRARCGSSWADICNVTFNSFAFWFN